MFDGIKVKIGDKEYVVPPLSLKQLRNGALAKIKEHDEIVADGDASVFAALPVRGEIIGMAIRRNYPDLTDEELFDELDVRNSTNLWLIVLGGTGLPTTEEGNTAAALPPLTTSGPSTDS